MTGEGNLGSSSALDLLLWSVVRMSGTLKWKKGGWWRRRKHTEHLHSWSICFENYLSSSNGILELTGTKWRCNVCHKKLFNKRNFPLVSQLAQTRTMESQNPLRVFIGIFSNILVDKLIQSLFRLLVFSTPRSNSFWWFLVVILQRKAKNWTNNYNTCALCLYVLILAMTINRHKKMFRYLSLILPSDRADTA